MSEIKVNSIKGVGASAAAITVNNTDGTCTANITSNGGGQLSNRNLVINGAMQVAQRATSVTSASGDYLTVDRFKYKHNGNDNDLTQSQADVASGTTPYTLGFRKSYKLTNGNQIGGAGTGDRCRLQMNLEAQDIANSGWNYKSSSSFITLSFWVKSSVAQNFYASIRAVDGTAQGYSFETGSLTADTWTKVTKTIAGNSNLTFDNNAELGWNMDIAQFFGTDRTSSGNTMNQWAAYDSSNLMPDNTGTWFTTNGATWEITGVQLEVGSVATDFEHRSFAQELSLCQRYFYVHTEGLNTAIGNGTYWTTSSVFCPVFFPVEMRNAPSMVVANDGSTERYSWNRNGGSNNEKGDNWSLAITNKRSCEIYDPAASGTAGHSCFGRSINADGKITFNSEL